MKTGWDGVRVLDLYDVIKPDGRRFLTSPDARRAFLERFREANLELARGDAALEDHLLSPPKDRDWLPPAPATWRERAAAYAVLAGERGVDWLRNSALPIDGLERYVRRRFSRRIRDKGAGGS